MSEQQKPGKASQTKPRQQRTKKSHGNIRRLGETALLLMSTAGFIVPGFFGHFYDPWVRFGFVQLFIVALLIWTHGWLGNFFRHRTSAILAIILLLILESAEYAVYYFVPEHRIHAQAAELIVNNGSDRYAGFWCINFRRITPFPKTGSPFVPTVMRPISIGLFLQMTNETASSFMVESFDIEIKNHDGSWEAMIPDNPIAGDEETPNHWFVLGEKNAGLKEGYFDARNPDFGIVIDHKNIASGETVEGWTFFDTKCDVSSPKIRLRIRDTTGKESVEPIEISQPLAQEAQTRQIPQAGGGGAFEYDVSNTPIEKVGDPSPVTRPTIYLYP